ncbi:MAG: Mammalian cell entry related domain protein [Solirubrobacterales bacterium]|nr:Mammalian cell entry related domain protein [Solirubrobacterales bacterium]
MSAGFNPRALVGGLLAAVAVLVLAIVLLGRDDTYTLKLKLADAAGLRDGSAVSIGGVRVGKVELTLGGDDAVHVALKIKNGKRVPRNARVNISAVNFLGQKQVAFSGGNPADPAPDGFVIPASRVTTATDLDQVLDTLDTDTRTRLAILVNEAGAAVVGRRWNISRDLQELPTTLSDAHRLLSEVLTDNHTLADLVQSSDSFIAATTAKRQDLVQLINTLGQTSQTVETKRGQLAATLAKAPRTLATLQRFLGELERTTVPLRPAARAITASAPALQDTLSRVEGFRKAADPALNQAADVAPLLTKLGQQATPVVRETVPTARSLARLTPNAVPLTNALNGSVDNLTATIENWSQAIQLRDGLGHIFRGEATFSPDAVASAIDRLTRPAAAKAKRQAARRPGSTTTTLAAPTPPAATGAGANKVTKSVDDTLKKATGAVSDLLKKVIPGLPRGASAPPAQDAPERDAAGLLDYLLAP